jgi:hypothetical protein
MLVLPFNVSWLGRLLALDRDLKQIQIGHVFVAFLSRVENWCSKDRSLGFKLLDNPFMMLLRYKGYESFDRSDQIVIILSDCLINLLFKFS